MKATIPALAVAAISFLSCAAALPTAEGVSKRQEIPPCSNLPGFFLQQCCNVDETGYLNTNCRSPEEWFYNINDFSQRCAADEKQARCCSAPNLDLNSCVDPSFSPIGISRE
ncbi:hypothetical protein C7999DRAFT_32676 [Corynascus novoguineensis]|uniref:Uncharacterized protein n=1 Tax=Corynascus novoguineensis TaxID=1126955 RepID=A0AAN7HIK1_9PEZI|nr:hypothetical protein C7999DRAFT_32676 [Corynascus novoguineensis]